MPNTEVSLSLSLSPDERKIFLKKKFCMRVFFHEIFFSISSATAAKVAAEIVGIPLLPLLFLLPPPPQLGRFRYFDRSEMDGIPWGGKEKEREGKEEDREAVGMIAAKTWRRLL